MEIGLYGLGRMGANMVRRLVRSGEHRVVAGNRSPGPVDEAVSEGAEGAYSMEEMVEKLAPPRAIWTMVPAGDATEQALLKFAELMDEGDILIDGGTRISGTPSAAPRYWAKGVCAFWTRGRAAASGGSESAIASW